MSDSHSKDNDGISGGVCRVSITEYRDLQSPGVSTVVPTQGGPPGSRDRRVEVGDENNSGGEETGSVRTEGGESWNTNVTQVGPSGLKRGSVLGIKVVYVSGRGTPDP